MLELRAIPTREAVGKKIVRAWTKSPSDVAEFTQKYGAKGSGYNVYFGVGKRAGEGGKKEDVLSIPALWADIDTVANGLDTEKVLARIGDLPKHLTPSIIVRSGGGLHCYWLLEHPYEFSSQSDRHHGQGYVEQVNAALRDLVGGDNVCDVTRVLRLPGTYNNKRRPEKPCEIVYCAHHITYDVGDLLHELSKHKLVLDGDKWINGKIVRSQEAIKRTKTDEERLGSFIHAFKGRSSAVLDRIWRDKVRQHAPRGYMGIHEAIVLTTARLHCQGYKPDEIVNKCVSWIQQVPDLDTSHWDWASERKKIEGSLVTWGPKWKQLQKEQRANGGTRTV